MKQLEDVNLEREAVVGEHFVTLKKEGEVKYLFHILRYDSGETGRSQGNGDDVGEDGDWVVVGLPGETIVEEFNGGRA